MKKSFKDTLNLPKTDFSIRANASKKEPEILDRWNKDDLYNKCCETGDKKFCLHDGPPFANGHMHMGHVLNRTIKDIVSKFKRMSGYKVVSVPGWDCHGLPIELKVTKEVGEDFDRVEFKKKCREYANKWIDIQKEEVKRLGVITDWDNPYITMSPEYEASILESFAFFVENGYIERKGKTIPWCASCKTVLATAEIEYQDKKDPSCYILFTFDKDISKKVFNSEKETSLLVWTTTPWTIPLNRAVVMHPTANYVLLQGKEDDKAFIVGEKLADKICNDVGIEKKVLATFTAKQLEKELVNHPYIENLKVPVILDDMVLLDDGTACVHSAPGCGPEDYFIGIKNGLEIFSPISSDGKYDVGIEPKELEGMPVSDGQIWSIKKMHANSSLFHKSSIRHSYPHCWRCSSPLIFRATDQWFCDLKKNELVDKSIKESNENVQFVPDWGKTRLTSSIASRTEWCLSRQRQWGVPITAIICNKCENAYLDPCVIRKIASFVEKEGIEFWDRVTIDDLKNQKIIPDDFSCEKCGNKEDFSKEMDILDVWFESGVSHTAVKKQHPELEIPADLYVEGSDQHRGWFQSSLLSAMIMYGKSCTKSFVTHAYVLDAQAQKMSKSKGNVISPQDIFDKYSADIVRLWVAGSDFEGDILVSNDILKNVSEVYRKIRNTCRFMISNLYDFDIDKDAVLISEMTELDQYALSQLQDISNEVLEYYKDYKFTGVFRTLNKYCTNDLSSFYLDIIKDRLYIEKKDGFLRRSSQTAMFYILDSLTRLIAPILSFLAEEVSDFYQKDKKESIHLQTFLNTVDVWSIMKSKKPVDYRHAVLHGVATNPDNVAFKNKIIGAWNALFDLRVKVLKKIEDQRETGLVKHSLESKVNVVIDTSDSNGSLIKEFIGSVKDKERFFKDLFIVSQCEVQFADKEDITVEHADGKKCPRCWQWDETDHEDELCKRCQGVLES